VTLLSFTRPSVQTELDRFFKSLAKSPESFESISKSAFTQARRKLRPEAFIELAKSQLKYFEEQAPNKKSWKGYRVVSIDGSLLNLPHTEDIKQEFGSVTNQYEEVISARSSFAYDVCNELVLDAIIAPRRSCEKDLAVAHLDSLNPHTDILVFDRGYPCQWLMGLLKQKGFKFCFRLSTAWKHAYEHMKEGENDKDWDLERASHREWGKLRTYGLSKSLKGLRLLSIKLSTGEKELLVTNIINREEFSYTDLKELYNLRWKIEKAFKILKKTLHIEHFTGKSPIAVKQDFYAKIFMMNLASMVRTQGVSKTPVSKYQYQSNKTQVLAKLKDFLVDLFCVNKIKKILPQLLSILHKRIEVVRPGRSFSRNETSSRRRHKIINSKGI
jgi:hypothetical protein